MFKVGDIVEITEESDATGILDFKKGKGYEVELIRYNFNGDFKGHIERHQEILLRDEGGRTDWYHYTHFKLKEGTKVEKEECLFKEGQEVHCVLGGEGVVDFINPQSAYPVKVDFANGAVRSYTKDGRLHGDDVNRALFFSPAVVTGATEPVFEPTLKEGDVVVMVDKNSRHKSYVIKVHKEDAEWVKNDCGTMFNKELFDFYKVGEKINFK